MIRTLKLAVKALLARFGVVIFKRSTGIYIAENETPALALRLCGIAEPMVVDGGAHRGSFVEAIRKLSPGARFLCFEPDPLLADALRTKFFRNPEVQIVPSALGSACGTADFNINRSRANNSLLSSSGDTSGRLGEIMETVERIEVEVTTLDEALRRAEFGSCDILKLDLQGHDLQALAGAAHSLRTVRVVIVEVWYAPVYTDSVTFLQIFNLLHDSGFVIYTLAGLHYSTADRLLWSDAIFVRADLPVLIEPLAIT